LGNETLIPGLNIHPAYLCAWMIIWTLTFGNSAFYYSSSYPESRV